MKVLDLLCRCYNCDYKRTVVTIRDNYGGRLQVVPNRIPDFVKNMYVRDFKLGQMENEHLTALEITIEGRDRV